MIARPGISGGGESPDLTIHEHLFTPNSRLAIFHMSPGIGAVVSGAIISAARGPDRFDQDL